MSFRKDNSPAGARISLSKVKGKPISTDSISIRFNPASADDDDDDYGFETTLKSEEVSKTEAVKFEIAAEDMPVESQASVKTTVPVTEASPSKLSPVSTAERSLLSGIRERFQDKIPEPLNAFIEKIEELSSESSNQSEQARKIVKSESHGAEMKLSSSASSEFTFTSNMKKSESMEPTRSSMSDLQSAASKNHDSEKKGDIAEVSTARQEGDKTAKSGRSNSLNIVDNHYVCETAIEARESDLQLNPGRACDTRRSPSAEKLVPSQNVSKPKSIQAKDSSPPKAEVPITLSGLLSSRISETDLKEKAARRADTPDTPKHSKLESKPESQPDVESDAESQLLSVLPEKQKLVSILVCVVAYLIIPLPSFLSGMVFGIAITYSVISIYNWLWKPPKPKEPMKILPLSKLAPIKVPEMRESKNEDGKFKVLIYCIYFQLFL